MSDHTVDGSESPVDWTAATSTRTAPPRQRRSVRDRKVRRSRAARNTMLGTAETQRDDTFLVEVGWRAYCAAVDVPAASTTAARVHRTAV